MFVVYSTLTTCEMKSYKIRAAAQKHADKLNDAYGLAGGFAVADRATYETKIVHMVERTNLMSGKKYMEPSNTPSYCSPSSEAYWSM